MSVEYQFLQNHPLGSAKSCDLPFSHLLFLSFLQPPALLPGTCASPPLCRALTAAALPRGPRAGVRAERLLALRCSGLPLAVQKVIVVKKNEINITREVHSSVWVTSVRLFCLKRESVRVRLKRSNRFLSSGSSRVRDVQLLPRSCDPSERSGLSTRSR